MSSLQGQAIFITGSSRGIGEGIARTCAREGAHVAITYRKNQEAAEALAAELEATYAISAHVAQLDVRDPHAIKREVRAFAERFGAVDGLVNNAGLVSPGLLVTQPIEKIRELLDTNLLGPIQCAKEVLPLMLARRKGVIINIGSVASGRPFRGQSIYAATKGGLEAFTRALAVEYSRKGIRAHCIVPGPIGTEMLDESRALAEKEILSHIPLKTFGTAQDVAEMAVFLLSERSKFVTGGVHVVDGGYLLG
ncbi:MAG: hypothetical protein AUK47_19595 [Deltaproteobacteria bacterium CG2_30_63_29]|nr:MAG: hypothetical protein AUK47_19595 [Deltaproteobacteria bacterium CG2_30_63_29]PIV99587.1 MAG: hypothetical protein COW42_10550 [Deltaproteobacteria bacterium CG17_big_fil_post_rev_8_21_14_2_50_63_7]PJB47550.1 MAG: hypothetical protein CO108_04000 [Deltaproteobacteria bacterium CG_4_9_14_3_um_filter_63_12]